MSSASIGRGVSPFAALERSELLAGLDRADIMSISMAMQPRSFEGGDELCREGDVGESLLVIVDGLAHVLAPQPDGPPVTIARQRRGEVVGATSLLTGEPHSATVVAGRPVDALALSREAFEDVVERYPLILRNLGRILSSRLVRSNLRATAATERGEAVALVVAPSLMPLLEDLAEATRAASAREVGLLDTRTGFDGAVAALDDLLAGHGTVLVVARAEGRSAPLLLDHVDRAVLLLSDEGEAERFRPAGGDGLGGGLVDVVLVAEQDGAPAGRLVAGRRLVRSIRRGPGGELPPGEIAWLGRHLSRTKLGLALGAGGAKGYAHVGALHVLRGAGYTVDYVSGASIGAIVGSYLALGMAPPEIEATLRAAFTPENVADAFKLSMAGGSTGLETITRIFRETTADRSFDDLVIPLTVMAVDLGGREPAPLRDGPLWEALLAATALAGMFPPYEKDGRRLVDGLALVPVPTGAVSDDGADVTVSVNLMSRDTLEAWPGEEPVPPAPPRRGSRMLDTLLEVMDLMQLDTSIRHAELADVPVTPRFGPGSWRDFHLSDLFLESGRQAMEERLPALQSLARPQFAGPPT